MSLLDAEVVGRLQAVLYKGRRRGQGAFSGRHRARNRGSSVEFAEHKEYSPGDELRHIDWRAYAKVDRYYVKQYEQETQLTAYVVIDGSASMAFGAETDSKFRYAARLASSLAYLLLHQGDAVGLAGFSAQENSAFVPARARPAHVHDIVSVLEAIERDGPTGSCSGVQTLERLSDRLGRRRAIIFVLSDLLADADGCMSVLPTLSAQGHDVVMVHVLDRQEMEFGFDKLAKFRDMESRAQVVGDPRDLRTRYHRQLEAFLTRIELSARNSGVEYHRVTTAQPLDAALLSIVRHRYGAE